MCGYKLPITGHNLAYNGLAQDKILLLGFQSINLFNQLCTKHVYGTRNDIKHSDRLSEKQMLI